MSVEFENTTSCRSFPSLTAIAASLLRERWQMIPPLFSPTSRRQRSTACADAK